MWPCGTHIYWITTSGLAMLQSVVMRHPRVMKYINPDFYLNMERVFRTEKSREDHERYVYKLKSLEDTSIKAPASESKVEEELKYELSKMKTIKKVLSAKQYLSKLRGKKDNANIGNK